MTSKAVYLSKLKPDLLYRITRGHRAIEIWKTTCIVTNFSEAKCSTLINPANPELSGVSKLPYFPRGGPVPEQQPAISAHHIMGYVGQWGGMDVGNGMLFPASVVDGLVHNYGGWKLQAECSAKRFQALGGEACPIGTAVRTSAGNGPLQSWYNNIIHTTPPFYKLHPEAESALQKCYRSALDLAFQYSSRVATPLLGSGARGFPWDVSVEVAASACNEWLDSASDSATPSIHDEVLVFGLLETSLATMLHKILDRGSSGFG